MIRTGARSHRTLLLGIVAGGYLSPAAVPAAEPLEVDVTVDPGAAGSGLKALTLQLSYQKDELSLPGAGTVDSVRARVQLVPPDPGKDDLLMVNDDDASATLRVVYVRQPLADSDPIAPGVLVHVGFDRSGKAAAEAVRCAVVGASDQTGRAIDGVQCTVQPVKR